MSKMSLNPRHCFIDDLNPQVSELAMMQVEGMNTPRDPQFWGTLRLLTPKVGGLGGRNHT